MGFESVFKALGNRDLILPYFEASILSERWPDHYDIRVDSSPYYGAGDGYFHPSTHPMMGERQLYYMFHPATKDLMVAERPHLKREMWFAMGSALHAVLQTQMLMAKLITSLDDDTEVEYVNHDHHVRGRIDWIVAHPNGQRIPVEFKTTTSYQFRQDEPKPEWVAQLQLGMDAVGEDFGIVLVAERGGMFDMREHHVRRDEALLADIYGKFDRVRQAIAENKPPKYCCTPESPTMHQCPAKFQCWLKEK